MRSDNGRCVSRSYWDNAISAIVYLLNHMHSHVLAFQATLDELQKHTSLPSVLTLLPRVFGCVAFVHLHKNKKDKLDPIALRCIFNGYSPYQQGIVPIILPLNSFRLLWMWILWRWNCIFMNPYPTLLFRGDGQCWSVELDWVWWRWDSDCYLRYLKKCTKACKEMG